MKLVLTYLAFVVIPLAVLVLIDFAHSWWHRRKLLKQLDRDRSGNSDYLDWEDESRND